VSNTPALSSPSDEASPALAAEAVIDTAIRNQARMTFYQDADRTRAVLTARIVGGDRDSLDLAGTGTSALAAGIDVTRPMHAVLCAGGRQYTFETPLERMPTSAAGPSWRLARPSHITPLRRRFQRARLRTSTPVSLRPMHGDRSSCSAVLLNITADGVACRVPADLENGIAKDTALWIRFTLAEDNEPYELPAEVVYRAAGGSPGQDVVGLKFLEHHDTVSIKQRLQDALRRYCE